MTKLRGAAKAKMNVSGCTQKELATKIGITPAMLSMAMSEKTMMKEERWRMLCELLDLDYDEIMGYKPSATQTSKTTEEAAQAETPAEPSTVEAQAEPSEDDPIDPRLAHNLEIMCAYTEGKIVEDIRQGGWTVELDKLRGLMDAVCDLREAISGAK